MQKPIMVTQTFNQLSAATPRICVCVLMNHPFPANLPLLRRIYGSRFSEVRYLIPFERNAGEDVIPVYRGSYTHAGYLNDAWHALKDIECDYIIMIHDDVLLNPNISENNFFDFFPLGQNDAFLSQLYEIPQAFGEWAWYAALFPKIFYPKSHLMGTGIERENLLLHLPNPEHLRRQLDRAGVQYTEHVRLDSSRMWGVAERPSRVVLDGLSGALASPEFQTKLDEQSLTLMYQLNELMLQSQRATGTTHDVLSDDSAIELPFPLVQAGYQTDFYILPRSCAEDFQHYIGVAAAANLFVEAIAPTLLFACCQNVRTARDFALDFSGFEVKVPFSWFLKENAVAMHPVKISAYNAPFKQQAFLRVLESINKQILPEDTDLDLLGHTPNRFPQLGHGWHAFEGWGAWSSHQNAFFRVQTPKLSSVRLLIKATRPENLSGSLYLNDRRVAQFNPSPNKHEIEIVVENVQPLSDGYAFFQLVSDRVMSPHDYDPNSADDRPLGLGIVAADVL